MLPATGQTEAVQRDGNAYRIVRLWELDYDKRAGAATKNSSEENAAMDRRCREEAKTEGARTKT